jgi:hypothetical protein
MENPAVIPAKAVILPHHYHVIPDSIRDPLPAKPEFVEESSSQNLSVPALLERTMSITAGFDNIF